MKEPVAKPRKDARIEVKRRASGFCFDLGDQGWTTVSCISRPTISPINRPPCTIPVCQGCQIYCKKKVWGIDCVIIKSVPMAQDDQRVKLPTMNSMASMRRGRRVVMYSTWRKGGGGGGGGGGELVARLSACLRHFEDDLEKGRPL